MNRAPLTKPQWKRILYYTFVGPLFGLAIVNLGLLGYNIAELISEPSRLASINWDTPTRLIGIIVFINFFGLIFCYVIGAIPALITGALAVRFFNKRDEVICAAIVGALPYLLVHLSLLLKENTYSLPNELPLLAVIGGLAGIACACTKRNIAEDGA